MEESPQPQPQEGPPSDYYTSEDSDLEQESNDDEIIDAVGGLTLEERRRLSIEA